MWKLMWNSADEVELDSTEDHDDEIGFDGDEFGDYVEWL